MNTISLHNTLPAVFANDDGRQSAVWRQCVDLRRGDRILVEAASGTGKSSLASFIFGYRRDYLGQILFDGRDIRTLRSGEWDDVRRRHISVLFQELRLFPELTAWDNVMIKNRMTGHRSADDIRALFDRLGLAHRIHTPVSRLSYGQQQRVALIRALCQPFDFLIADEPVSHLDDANASVMASVISEEVQATGAAVVVTSIGKHFDLGYTRTLRL